MVSGPEAVVLGGSGVDTIVYVPVLPVPFADSYPVPTIETRAGQTGDGVTLGLHALGVRTALLDTVGGDREGELVRDLHRLRGVSFIGVPTRSGTKRAVNLVSPDGRRLSFYDTSRGDPADRFPQPLLSDLVRSARHVHVSITSPCQHSLPLLDSFPVTVSTDLHDWDGENPYHAVFARRADIVFMSATALVNIAATMRKILAFGTADTVVATAGAAGGYLLTRQDGTVREYSAAVPPGPVIDSNGAGDAFVAGFLFGHLRGEPLPLCLRYGAVAGAHACTIPSTRVDPISREALLAAAGSG
ncbi:MAG TPA: PfkB family carbohydrate kinase [Rugosimonospora sp.]